MNFAKRITNFQNKVLDNKLDGFIVTNPTNIFYLTGFKGVLPYERESILIFNPKLILIAPRLYQNEAKLAVTKLKMDKISIHLKVARERDQIFKLVKNLLKNCRKKGLPTEALAKVGFEEADLKFSEHRLLTSYQLPGTRYRLVPFEDLIEKMRVFKTEEEIEKIEKGQIISQKAFNQLVKTIKIGQTEAEIAERLTKIIKSLGAEDLAFESVVASGKNARLPHYVSGKKKIKRGEVLLFDFGAKFQNYCADLSRTIFVGRVKDQHKNIYSHVQQAQKVAIGKIVHGTSASDAYHAANNVFKKQNLNQYFLHGLGHGVGLEIHENPHLRPSLPTTNDQLLTNGMVFSVEPGLYFPWGGIRIEDLVLVKNGRAKILGKQTDRAIEI